MGHSVHTIIWVIGSKAPTHGVELGWSSLISCNMNEIINEGKIEVMDGDVSVTGT